ncbi:ABC transporter permease [Candidatus Nanosynbacter featherlites]|uniref:FtsX-like permease family protein n=1 Tax=Candidatus Nanosynbacter featherlites TaxID=2572088 RepID=A0A4P9A3X7_9BACT|nr:ABC transporter permease [Candidatus Nanosynbacter featherlites]QCT42530.1 FtsX-like permease family protein [Candidatus Nanosynbacter featherlites]
MSVSWMLLQKSGRQSFARLGLTTAAVALGIVLVCGFMAGINGIMGRSTGGSAISLAAHQASRKEASQQPINGVEPLRISNVARLGNASKWHGQLIQTYSIYGTAKSPQFAKLKTPGPGEYYLSRALADAVAQYPDDNILARFGKNTKYLGVLPSKYTASPDALMMVRGASAEEVAASDDVAKAQGQASYFANVYRTDANGLKSNIGLDPISIITFGVGGAILLFPIVIFVSVATQLGAAQREKRYAALRLIGATKRQVTRILLLESLLASVAGVVIGLGAFWLLQAPLQQFKMDGMRFNPGDLALTAGQYALIIGLTLGLTTFVNWRRMRRAQISPLGVSRSIEKVKKLRGWRALVPAAGIAIFAWLSSKPGLDWLTANKESAMPILLLMAALLLVMFGIILAGGWLTNKLSLLAARWANNGSMLIAGKRTAVHSRTVFRGVSGVVLALFAGSFYLTATSGIENLNIQAIKDNGYSQLKHGTAAVIGRSLPGDMAKRLQQESYVTSVATVYPREDGNAIRCQDVARYTEHTCPTNARPDQFALLNFDAPVVKSVSLINDKVDTNGAKEYLVAVTSDDNIEKLRSMVVVHANQYDLTYVVSGTDSKKPHINPTIREFANLAYVGIGVTLFVAVASLIVSTIGGLMERRRSLYTLRLGGMRLVQLKRLVMVESVAPLVITSILSCSIGVWTGAVFTKMFSTTLKPVLTPTYFAIVGIGLAAAIIGIYLILPMVDKLTRAEANQTE